jgi:hypothetical protein
VPGHKGIDSNEIADQLARKGSLHPFIGPKPTCDISGELQGVLSGAGCTGNTKNIGSPFQDNKGFSAGPSAKMIAEFLKLSGLQARQVTELLTGHCHLRGHLLKLGKVNNPLVGGATMKQKRPRISYVTVRPWLN